MDNTLHKRHSIRLYEYDYSLSGMYFVTICTQNKVCLFGKVVENTVGAGLCPALTENFVELSEHGKIIEEQWNALPHRFSNIVLHEYVIMPNHFHAIIEIEPPVIEANIDDIRAGQSPAPTVGNIIGAFKSISTKECNKMDNVCGRKIWQRNYYEHIIRNQKSYTNITDYIASNPINWQSDDYYIN